MIIIIKKDKKDKNDSNLNMSTYLSFFALNFDIPYCVDSFNFN